MAALAGLGVLVTRPEQQAQRLCELIEAEGGSALRFPALAITPVADRAAVRAAIGPVDRYHLIVFTSANAVRFGADLLGQRGDLTIAAIGRATAQALEAAGHRVSLVPTSGADSEALLAMPELGQMSGRRVLIVRGRGGRELLAETLAARGAEVALAETYERAPARPTPEALARLEELWRQGAIHAYTATSPDLLEALLGIVTPRCRELMDSTPMLTGAARVAELAARRGLGSPVVLAERPEDESLVAALVRWRTTGERRP